MANAERKRLTVLVGVFVVVLVVAAIRYFSEGGLTGEAVTRTAIEYSPHDLPALGALAPERAVDASDASHRNPFVYGVPPTPTRNLTPPPTLPPRPTRTPFTPRPTPTRCVGCPPGPPPKFDRSYLGAFGPRRLPIAVFRKNEDVEIGFPGLVMEDKFIVREVGLESVVIGFVGYPEEVSTRVPLEEN